MSKIKNIQINDFRIYDGQQEYSFDNEGNLSNLMVIYAPNGFGKTSFFDAVEWCYTSKIRRFENEILGNEIKRRAYSTGDQILLTNRTSYKQGKHGSVKITTADNKIVERTATDRKANNEDYKYDYLPPSIFNSAFAQKSLDTLVKTNILTQDQIDEFLRHTKPEQRFAQMQNFWPEGENAISILKSIDSYIAMLNTERNEILSKITAAENELGKLLNAHEQIDPINKTISDLKTKYGENFNIQPLTFSVNIETYQILLNTVQTYIERAKLKEGHLVTSSGYLEALHQDLEKFQKWNSARETLEAEIETLSKLQIFYTYLEAQRILLKSVINEIEVGTSVERTLSRLLEIVDDVTVIYIKLNEQRESVVNFRELIDTCLKMQRDQQKSLEALQTTFDSWENNLRDKQLSLSTWDSEHENYKFWLESKTKNTEKLETLTKQVKNVELDLSEVLGRRQLFQAVVENKKYTVLPDEDIKNIEDKIAESNKIISAIQSNEDFLQSQETKLKKSSSLDETFDRIITWSKDYISNTDATHCPLCATDFKNVESLLARVELQKTSHDDSTALIKSLEDAKTLTKSLNSELVTTTQAINDYLTKVVETCGEEIGKLQIQIELTTSEISNVKNTITQSENEIVKSLSKLNLSLADGKVPNDQAFQEAKDLLQLKLAKESLNVARLENIIKYRKNRVHQIDNTLSNTRNKISAAENNIAISLSNKLYVEAAEKMILIDIQADELKAEGLNNRKLAVQDRLKEKASEKSTVEAKISDINKQIEDIDLKYKEVDLPGIKQTKQNELSDNRALINGYLSRFRTVSENDEPTDAFFKEQDLKLKKRLESAKTEITDMENLSIDLKIIEKNVQKNSLEKEIEKLQFEIPPIDLSIEKVTQARTTSENYINVEINRHFNQDVINEIYSRIEPHPNLKEIKINPQITQKGPILDIKAISQDEELNPSLFLSAGQLNVLSLSIFLAKTFETPGVDISTIFMDDPIQNLSDINILSFIDIIRTMITTYDRQIVISSHDENFYKLMRNKMPTDAFNVRYYEIESYGKANCII